MAIPNENGGNTGTRTTNNNSQSKSPYIKNNNGQVVYNGEYPTEDELQGFNLIDDGTTYGIPLNTLLTVDNYKNSPLARNIVYAILANEGRAYMPTEPNDSNWAHNIPKVGVKLGNMRVRNTDNGTQFLLDYGIGDDEAFRTTGQLFSRDGTNWTIFTDMGEVDLPTLNKVANTAYTGDEADRIWNGGFSKKILYRGPSVYNFSNFDMKTPGKTLMFQLGRQRNKANDITYGGASTLENSLFPQQGSDFTDVHTKASLTRAFYPKLQVPRSGYASSLGIGGRLEHSNFYKKGGRLNYFNIYGRKN